MAIARSSEQKLTPGPGGATLGTFAGVFTPSVLTILGIILFRRLGFVVGSAGLERALVIIFLASAISVLTSVSLAAIATNMKVKGGGVYYLISRTLGVEFGGAIGIVLFLAQSVSITFYCMGFAEAVSGMLFNGHVAPEIIAGAAVAFLFVFAWLGADWATRLQYVVMAILAAALASFFAGGFTRWDTATLMANLSGPSAPPDFWFIFAIFFPAVTGFTQGVSMSGDLREPGKSLVLGTFSAVGLSTVVYFIAAVVLAAAVRSETLVNDYGAMKQAASIDWLIEAGVISATLSSAMASFLGAPRILQSIARDRIFPLLRPFAQGVGDADNPRRAVLFSGAIALGTLFLGSMNYVAAVVSMFFLISYGLLNYATFAEARAASPSFRPRFRFFNAKLSLVGALGCLGAMAAIDVTSSLIAMAVLFAIHQYLRRTAGPARWADSRYSYHFQSIRENLLSMAEEPEHPRGWRPCILAFCDDPDRRERLLKFASWIEGASGLTTAVQVIEGEGTKNLQARDKTQKELESFIAAHGLDMFARALVAPEFRVGVESLLQSFGMGRIRANMVLLHKLEQLSWKKEDEGQIRYGRELQEAVRLGCNVVVLDAAAVEWSTIEKLAPDERRIDVWWWGDKTSRLMLLLAYLMTRNAYWEDAKLRVLAPSSQQGAEKTMASLQETLEEVRIDAEPQAVVDTSLDKVLEMSAKSAVVFFPLRFRELQLFDSLGPQVDALLERLPVVALTLAGEAIDLAAGPEEGESVEKAVALDAVADSEKKAQEAERKAAELAEVATKKLSELKTAADSDQRGAAEAAHRDAEELAKEARRIAEESRIMAEKASQAAAEAGAEPAEPGAEEAAADSGETIDRSEVIGFPASSKPGEK